jgi:hypothetical protein
MYVRRWLLWTASCIALVFPVIGHGQDLNSSPVVNTLQNDPITGTLPNRLAKITPQGTLILPATTGDDTIKLYVVIAGAGTTGSAVYVEAGNTGCEMDSITSSKAGTYITRSPTTPGRCHQQDAPPANGMVVGTLLASSTVVGGVARISALNTAYIPGSGAVSTSIGLTMPTEYTVAGSPVINSGALTVAKATQTANQGYFGPVSGGAAQPGFRLLVPQDLPTGTATGAPAGDLGGVSYAAPLVLAASTSFKLSGSQPLITLSGDVSNYNPTNFTTRTTFFFDGGTAPRRFTGLVAQPDGDVKVMCNAGATDTLIFSNQDPSSSAANRFLLGEDFTTIPGQCATLRYDATAGTQRWRNLGGAIPDSMRLRPVTVQIGDPDPGSPLLVNGNDSAGAWTNMFRRPAKVLAISCMGNVGATTVTPILRGGSPTSLLTGPCTCGNGTPRLCKPRDLARPARPVRARPAVLMSTSPPQMVRPGR